MQWPSIISILVLSATFMAVAAAPSSDEQDAMRMPLFLSPVAARSAVEYFTLGSKIEGAVPLYAYQNTLNYDDMQEEVISHVSYPSEDADDNAYITQVSVYLEGSDGFVGQVYVTEGGIGDSSVLLELVASNTESLRYMVIIYGQKL